MTVPTYSECIYVLVIANMVTVEVICDKFIIVGICADVNCSQQCISRHLMVFTKY